MREEKKFISGAIDPNATCLSGLTTSEMEEKSNNIYLKLSSMSKNTHELRTVNGLGRQPNMGGVLFAIAKRNSKDRGKYSIHRRFTYLAYGNKVDEKEYNYIAFRDIPAGKPKVI